MNNTKLDEQKNSPSGGDEWGLELRTGIGKRADESKRAVELNAQESRIIVEVMKHNNELRRWLRWTGIFAFVLFVIAALIAKIVIGYEWLMIVFLVMAFAALGISESKYDSLKLKGILLCENCGARFVPRENDLNKKCPYCNQGHTTAHL